MLATLIPINSLQHTGLNHLTGSRRDLQKPKSIFNDNILVEVNLCNSRGLTCENW